MYGEGSVVLGSPIGSLEYVTEEVNKKIDKIRNITSLLPTLKDPHYEFVLLRSCFSLPKIMYLMRTIDPMSIQQHLSEFDDVVRICLSDILGSPLGDKEWHQATLPVSAGGAGLRNAQKHAPAAYVSSVISSTDLLSSIC